MCAVIAFFNISFAAAIHVVLVRFSEDPNIVRELVRLEEDLEENVVGGKFGSISMCPERS